ncbi:MAG TPA: potassium channel protein [Ferruginibacter sp.]|nr:potassium channel protein [Ferruginibacter sp.]
MYFLKRLNLFKGLFSPFLLLLAIVFIGTVGYILIEDYNFLEALYMTIITVASVGFNEVRPLSEPGRIFTIILIVMNIGLFAYFVGLLTHYFFDLEFINNYKKFKMENKIHHLKDHVIICGFGRNGKESAQVLHDNKIPFVVIEEKIDLPTDLNFKVPFFIKGDSTKDEILLEAGIKNARAVITTLPIDPDNLFVVLTARQLNPAVYLISRASQDTSVNKLKVAGANNVIMPDKIGGAHMATLVMLPDVVEMLSLMTVRNNVEFRVAEVKANKSISLYELDLWKRTNCTILGIKDETNKYNINPPSSYQVNPGERLIVMGSDEQINEAKKII